MAVCLFAFIFPSSIANHLGSMNEYTSALLLCDDLLTQESEIRMTKDVDIIAEGDQVFPYALARAFRLCLEVNNQLNVRASWFTACLLISPNDSWSGLEQ